MEHKSVDSVGEAVTNKIREAITNKLAELNVPFEKELPDYIMVMVANKKSRSQMEEDLFLFLGDGTTAFMEWFENVMKKFQSNSVKQLDDVSFPDTNENKTCYLSAGFKGKLEIANFCRPHLGWQSESDVLTLEIPEQDADFLGEDLKDVSKSFASSHSINLCKKTLPDTKTAKVLHATLESKLKELPISSRKRCLEIPENSFSLQQKVKSVPCSAVIPVKRPKIHNEIDNEQVEQTFGSVASIIRVTERKSSVPIALQANKLLLLKAVDAANKSVMGSQKYVKSSKSAKEENSVELKTELPSGRDIRIAVLDEEVQPSSLMTIRRKPLDDDSYLLAESSHSHINIIYPTIISELTNLVPPDMKMVYDPLDQSFGESMSVAIKTNDLTAGHSKNTAKACVAEVETTQHHSAILPQFVVTLDGIDPNTLKKKEKYCDIPLKEDPDATCYPRAVMDAEAKDFVALERKYVPSMEQKQKINEKCHYWPACKSGDLCNYHHPTTTCKAFPNCAYADKCLFIHPNCKFDALCTRKDCPYTHASKRKISIAEIASPKKHSSSTDIPCRYFPNCVSEKCTFFHPRTCWYGSRCKLPSCPYSHPLPVREQLKWCAQ